MPADIFTDLAGSDWAKDAIVSLAEEGIISGRGDGTFAPQDNVTREEFVKIIVSAFLDEENNSGSQFADVDKNAWYAPYIYTAYNAGIVSGIGEDAFGVGMLVTRQDMAAILYRTAIYIGIPLPDGSDRCV